MFDALPAGSTSVLTMRSPGLLGRPTKLVGLFTPPQTTALVTSHLPFLLGSTTYQPLKSFPFSRGFHPLSVRYGGSPWSLPSFNGGRPAAMIRKTEKEAKTMAAAMPARKCFTCATPCAGRTRWPVSIILRPKYMKYQYGKRNIREFVHRTSVSYNKFCRS